MLGSYFEGKPTNTANQATNHIGHLRFVELLSTVIQLPTSFAQSIGQSNCRKYIIDKVQFLCGIYGVLMRHEDISISATLQEVDKT